MLKIKPFSAISNGALKTKDLPTRLKIMDIGTTKTLDEPVVINEKSLKEFNANQAKLGRKRVAIDFNHGTVPESEAYVNGNSTALAIAAYGTPVLDNEGLWLTEITWTPDGERYARDYEDLSPALILDKDNVMIGLHSVALTPTGAIEDLHFYSSKMPGFQMDSTETDNEECDLKDFDAEDQTGKYGNVDYADKKNNKYPIDTKEHVKAAWSYINQTKNADKYDESELSVIKSHIKAAAKKFGIEISETKTMSSADNVAQLKTKTNMEQKLIALAAKLNLPDEKDTVKLLDTLIADWESKSIKPAVVEKETKTETFSAEFNKKFKELEDKYLALEQKSASDKQKMEDIERNNLISNATKAGKVIPLSADNIKKVDITVLKEMVEQLPNAVVPLKSKMKTFSSQTQTTSELKGLSKASAAIEEQIKGL